MENFEKILKLTSDYKVELAQSFKEVIHKELVLGQTRHVCRFGTLSDGHEKITPSQRYYQAIKELWHLGVGIKEQEALTLRAQADLLDAKELLEKSITEQDKLRAKAKIILAEQNMLVSLVNVEDKMRMVDEYNKIRIELKDEVTSQYPGGIEEAEKDNWEAVFKYRMQKERLTGLSRERTDNIPLSPEHKARLGYDHGRIDAIAPLMVSNEKACRSIASEWESNYLEYQNEVKNKAEA